MGIFKEQPTQFEVYCEVMQSLTMEENEGGSMYKFFYGGESYREIVVFEDGSKNQLGTITHKPN